MKAVILAAGIGSRLLPYSRIVPKPLMPVEVNKDGSFRTIIERIIGQIVLAGISEILIVINYSGEMIKEYIGSGHGCRIRYVVQEKLDGNAGAFYCAQPYLADDDVLVTDCDNFFTDSAVFLKMKKEHQVGQEITVGVSKVRDIAKYAIIKLDKKGKPIDIYEKPTDEKTWGSLAKSGAMIFSGKISQLDKSISKAANGEYTTTQIVKYCIDNNFKAGLARISFTDIGTWDEYVKLLKKNLGT